MPDTDAALHRAEELRSILSRPVQLSTGRTLTVTPSIGLVRLADVGREASEVLQDADMAMLQAKTRGRGRVAIFDAGLREEVGSRLELEHDLRAAVENGELRLEYQPLASLANGRVLGLEALVRWEHPRRGLLLPGRFVGLAEESELIIALGQWVLEAGCAQMARWRAMYPEANDSFLAVNVSPRQFDGSQLLPAVRGALEKSGLPPGALMLEITESGIVSDDVRLHGMLGELREFGIRLAIDDFGTGYSSLSYLKRLPVSYLKIDRSFVMGLGQRQRGRDGSWPPSPISATGSGCGSSPKGWRTVNSDTWPASSGATSTRDTSWPNPGAPGTSRLSGGPATCPPPGPDQDMGTRPRRGRGRGLESWPAMRTS